MRKALALIGLRLRRNWRVMLAIATLSTAFAGAWWQFDVFDISGDEASAYDAGLQKFELATKFPWNLFPWAKAELSRDITVLAIDEESTQRIARNSVWTQKYGIWPYHRNLWGDLAPWLKSVGVRALVYDAVMDDPHVPPEGDNALRESLQASGYPMYLGYSVHPEAPKPPKVEAPVNRLAPEPPEGPPDGGAEELSDFPDEPTPEQQKKLDEEAFAHRVELSAREIAFPVRTEGGLELPTFPAESGRPVYPRPPIVPVLGAVSGWGAVLEEGDDDGKLRSTRFAYTDGVNTYVTLPVAAAADLFGAKELVLSPGHLKLGDHDLRIDPDGSAKIDYRGTFKARFPQLKLARALQCFTVEKNLAHPEEAAQALSKEELEAERALLPGCKEDEQKFLAGRVVLLAGVGTGMGDSKSTPLESSVPGSVKQAATLQNLLDGRFVVDAPFWMSLLFAFLVAVFSSMLVLAIRNNVVDIVWPVLLYVGFFILTGAFLLSTRVHVLSAMPGLCGTVASLLSTAWERLFAGKERERMKEMFQNYMEADLVELMVEQKELPKLDGETQQVTAFFSDIRGFSSFSEHYRDDPRGLMRVLNRYFSAVTPVITDQGACIDKYVGDSVVALFGAPIRHEDHALRACKAALAVQQAIAELREQFRKEGLPDMYTRVGLNTDAMCVGNVGSDQLIDYTAIGDGMNLASRLEGVNKAYGTLILMGEKTWQATRGEVEAREVDQVRVAGKQEVTTLYELLAMKGGLDEPKRQLIALYAQALAAYRSREFGRAKGLLEQALQLDAGDGPSRTLHQRCTRYEASPPPAEWDGVTTLEK